MQRACQALPNFTTWSPLRDARESVVDRRILGLRPFAVWHSRQPSRLAVQQVGRIITIPQGGPPNRGLSPSKDAWAEKQLALRANTLGTRLASQLVEAKILNQRALLLYHSKYASRPPVVRQHLVDAAQQLERAAQELGQHSHLPLPGARTKLLLIEARAAIVYWRAFGSLVPEQYAFRGRRKRDARDAVNAALNYGYWVLMARSWQALDKKGLHPYMGFFTLSAEKIIFEFQHADVLFVRADGTMSELRSAAIDLYSGEVGTTRSGASTPGSCRSSRAASSTLEALPISSRRLPADPLRVDAVCREEEPA